MTSPAEPEITVNQLQRGPRGVERALPKTRQYCQDAECSGVGARKARAVGRPSDDGLWRCDYCKRRLKYRAKRAAGTLTHRAKPKNPWTRRRFSLTSHSVTAFRHVFPPDRVPYSRPARVRPPRDRSGSRSHAADPTRPCRAGKGRMTDDEFSRHTKAGMRRRIDVWNEIQQGVLRDVVHEISTPAQPATTGSVYKRYVTLARARGVQVLTSQRAVRTHLKLMVDAGTIMGQYVNRGKHGATTLYWPQTPAAGEP